MTDPGTDQDHPAEQEGQLEPRRLTASRLRERGWTAGMVEKLLGPPDARKAHPSYLDSAPMKLYDLERVEQAERADAFFELLERSERRKDAGDRAGRTRRARTLATVEALPITLPTLSGEDLVLLACQNDNRWLDEQGRPSAQRATPESDAPFLARLCVNALRYDLTGQLSTAHPQLFKQVGAREARARFTQRVLQTIAQTYPHLALECERQHGRPLVQDVGEG